MHTVNGTVQRAIQTMKNLLLANMEDGNNLTESVHWALKPMRFTIHTGLKKTPFELHHGRKPRTELTNIIKDRKSFLSDWSDWSVLALNRPKTGNSPIIWSWPQQKLKNGNWLRIQNHRRKETR